jgi:hypothetical protein
MIEIGIRHSSPGSQTFDATVFEQLPIADCRLPQGKS